MLNRDPSEISVTMQQLTAAMKNDPNLEYRGAAFKACGGVPEYQHVNISILAIFLRTPAQRVFIFVSGGWTPRSSAV